MRPHQQIACTRVYPATATPAERNPEWQSVTDYRYRHEVENWIEYNRRHRPDAALFVDKELRHKGGFPSNEAAEACFMPARRQK